MTNIYFMAVPSWMLPLRLVILRLVAFVVSRLVVLRLLLVSTLLERLVILLELGHAYAVGNSELFFSP